MAIYPQPNGTSKQAIMQWRSMLNMVVCGSFISYKLAFIFSPFTNSVG